MTLKYKKEVFNKNYAVPFVIVQRVLFGGFVLFFLLVVAGIFNINVDFLGVLSGIIIIYIIIGVIGFPFVSVLKKGQEVLMKGSEVRLLENNVVEYYKVTEQLWTILGFTQELKTFTITDIKAVSRGKMYYTVYGNVEYICEYNGKVTKNGSMNKVKIPIVFEGMERIESYAE